MGKSYFLAIDNMKVGQANWILDTCLNFFKSIGLLSILGELMIKYSHPIWQNIPCWNNLHPFWKNGIPGIPLHFAKLSCIVGVAWYCMQKYCLVLFCPMQTESHCADDPVWTLWQELHIWWLWLWWWFKRAALQVIYNSHVPHGFALNVCQHK